MSGRHSGQASDFRRSTNTSTTTSRKSSVSQEQSSKHSSKTNGNQQSVSSAKHQHATVTNNNATSISNGLKSCLERNKSPQQVHSNAETDLNGNAKKKLKRNETSPTSSSISHMTLPINNNNNDELMEEGELLDAEDGATQSATQREQESMRAHTQANNNNSKVINNGSNNSKNNNNSSQVEQKSLTPVISVNNKVSPLPPTNAYTIVNGKRNDASKANANNDCENIDLESTSQTEEGPFTEVHSKPKKAQSKKLPAIKLRISDPLKTRFNNPLAVFNELKRCFPSEDLKIKFAEIAKFDTAILIIATDDEVTHSRLNNINNWLPDAFGRGIRMKHQAPSTPSGGAQVTYSFSIKNIPLEVDVGSDSVIDHFKGLGFTKIVRSLKRETNEPTSYLKLYTESKEVYNKHMYKGEPVYFLYQRCYAIPETRPLQCRNCQGTGHIAFNCPKNEPTCCRCGGTHRLRDCDKFNIIDNVKIFTKTFCVNCSSEDHIACSRKCKFLQDHVREKEAAKAQKLAQKQPQKQQQQPQQQQKSAATQNTQHQPSYSSMTAKNLEKSAHKTTTPSDNSNNNNKNKQSNLEVEFKEIKAFLVVLLGALKDTLPKDLLAQCPATIMSIIAQQPVQQ